MKYFLLFVAFLCGNAFAAPVQLKEKLQQQERIGYLVDVDDSPIHSHMGAMSVLPDEDDPYPYNWKLNQRIQERFNKKIRESSQFQMVNLAQSGFAVTDLTALNTMDKTRSAQKQQVIDRLKNDLHIRTIVIFSRSSIQTKPISCGSSMLMFITCPKTKPIKTGLLTKGGRISRSGYAVADVIANVYVLDQLINLSAEGPIAEANGSMTNEILTFTEPKSIKSIAEEEWTPVRAVIEESIDRLVDTVVNELIKNRQ